MSGYVAAFLGGILFVFVVSGCVAWWTTRHESAPDGCPHCRGTGLLMKDEERHA